MRTDKSAQKKNFSLAELIMVLSVFVLAVAIVFPTLKRAREYSFQTVCAGNLRQIGIACNTYKNETGSFPLKYHFMDDFRLIYPYVKDLAVFTCPGNPRSRGELSDESQLNGGTDYLYYPGDWVMTDNNPLKVTHGRRLRAYGVRLDMGSNSNDPAVKKLRSVYLAKDMAPAVYDRTGPAHFGMINVCHLKDVNVQQRPYMNDLWTLTDDRMLIIDSTTAFPEF